MKQVSVVGLSSCLSARVAGLVAKVRRRCPILDGLRRSFATALPVWIQERLQIAWLTNR